MSGVYANKLILSFAQLAQTFYGVSQQELVQSTHLNFSLLESSQVNYYPDEVAATRLFQLLHECRFYHNDELRFTKRFFDNFSPSHDTPNLFNTFIIALMNKPNFLSCLILIIEFCGVINKNSRFDYIVDGKYTYLTHQFVNEERNFNTSQGLLYACYQIIKTTAPYIPFYPEFLFTHKQIPNAEDFVQYTNDKISFSQAVSAIKFETKLLEMKSPFANPLISDNIDHMEKKVFAFFQSQHHITQRVEYILGQYLIKAPEKMDIKQICQDMNMSSATLQRHLAKEDRTFKDILEAVRRKHAVQLLQHSTFQIAQISDHLGYANVSSFNRAFKRWFMASPLEFRNVG